MTIIIHNMKSMHLKKQLLLIEITGFIFIVIILWLDEIFDFPHLLFNTPATPVNWLESMIESGIIIILASFAVYLTVHLTHQIKYLEGLLRICSNCKKIYSKKEWIPIETYIARYSNADFTHGLCPECYKKFYKKALNQIK